MGRIILYSIVIVILVVTRLKWTKHGRKVTKSKIIVESIFFLVLGSIVIFDSFYNRWYSNFISYSLSGCVFWFTALFLFTFKSVSFRSGRNQRLVLFM